jgi:hypothetical protein
MGIHAFGVERQRRLGVHQPGRAGKWDRLEVGVSAPVQGTDQGGVRDRVDFAEPVVRQSLVELPDHVGKPLLLAVVAMVRNRLAELSLGIPRLDSKRGLSALPWRDRTEDVGL